MRPRVSRALLLILALALVARAGVIVATPHFKPIFDAAHYDRLGDSIAHGHGYFGQFQPATPSAFRPPLYPFALAAVHLVGGGWTAERLLSALFGVVAVLLVFLISRGVWGERVAVVAGTIAAIFPPLVLLSASILSESLFVPLALAVVLAILEYRRDARLRWAIAAGVLCGLAALTRQNGLLLVIAAAGGVWAMRPRLSRRALAPPVAVLAATVLTITPWVIRNTIEFHRFVGISTQSGYALGATYNPQSGRKHPAGTATMTYQVPAYRDLYARPLDEGVRSNRLTSRSIDYATGHPGYVARTLVWNTLRILDIRHDTAFKLAFQANYLQALGDARLASRAVPASVYLLLALALLGVVAQIVRGTVVRRAPWYVWAVPILLVLPAVPVYGLARYRSPVDPFLAMLAAVGLVAAYERVLARRTQPDAGAVATARP
jgi:4-amino-4-deoxy-L-arabinose transferase-like glycosyltransferase